MARTRYRRVSYLSDIRGIKSAIGEMKGLGHPVQPRLNKDYRPSGGEPDINEQWFIERITDKIAGHPGNAMEFPFTGERMFEEPLVGFVSGDDQLLLEYKRIIGSHHFTPYEIMAWQAEKKGLEPPPASELSVVSFIMPFTRTIKDENGARDEWLSERWAQGRLLGEVFSQTLVREIVTELMDKGVLAVAPDVTPMFNKKRYPEVGWASPWSHRHMAYAAGLGTFGMQDFLITEKGCAHRCGSFVVHKRLQPDRKRPDDIHAWCLHRQGVECLACAKRCPVEAVNADGHDKEACYRRVARTIRYCNRNYHIFIYGCGLCSTGVPCESGIPEPLEPGT